LLTAHILWKRIILGIVLILGTSYGSDFVYLRLRMRHLQANDPFETVKALRVLAIPEKNGKASYELDAQNPEQTVTCVRSVFPHYGCSPCWYVKPRINKPIQM